MDLCINILLKSLKEKVVQAHLDLPKYGLVTFIWGDVSGVDRDKGLMVIKKQSGVAYDKLKIEDLVDQIHQYIFQSPFISMN